MRRAGAVFAAVCALGGCTRSAPTEVSPSAQPRTVPSRVAVEGRTFDVSCTPVAEALVDIKLPHAPGDPMVRAITGIWDQQAVAVLTNDRWGCGVWALAIARDVSGGTAAQIRQEVAAGVERFGVTASPVPRDEDSG
jgi:hypothetical protein